MFLCFILSPVTENCLFVLGYIQFPAISLNLTSDEINYRLNTINFIKNASADKISVNKRTSIGFTMIYNFCLKLWLF